MKNLPRIPNYKGPDHSHFREYVEAISALHGVDGSGCEWRPV